MNDSPPKFPSNRWRFQFSLRSLMLAVFTYVGLWALTANLGTTALAQKYAESFQGKITAANTITVINEADVRGELTLEDVTYRYSIQSKIPLPFVIWINCRYGNDVIREGIYVWVFGKIWALHVAEPGPARIFNPDSTWVISE